MEAPLKPKPSDKKYFELRTLKVAAPQSRGVVYRLATSGVVNRKEGNKALLHHTHLNHSHSIRCFPLSLYTLEKMVPKMNTFRK
jgi:hypothetical protein